MFTESTSISLEDSNFILKARVREQGKAFCKSLGQEIQDVCDADPEMEENRRPLYFQLEPFFMEFQDSPKQTRILVENYDEYANWINRRLQGVKNQGLKVLRASFFAWLSYYHPSRAKALLEKHKASIPLYQGHPDLSRCSAEARAQFRWQTRNEGQDAGEAEPRQNLSQEGSSSNGIALQTNPEPTSNQATASRRNTPEKEAAGTPVPEDAAQEPPEKVEEGPLVEALNQEEKGGDRKFVIAGLLVTLLLLGTAITAAFNPGIFRPSSEEDETASEESPTNLATTDDPVIPQKVGGDESGDKVEDAVPTEAEEENESAVSTPEPPREINPVWNNITGFAWSTKELNYYYPTLRSANLSDLQEAARQGNTAAQTLLGVAHISGWLGQRDYGLAIREYLRPACANGQGLAQGRACALLGVHYGAGLGVPKNITTAAEFYSKACRLGNLTGCYYEGVRYLHGEGIARDLPRAITIFKDTCELGVGYSCRSLSDIYGQGNGVEKDLELATWYELRYQRLKAPI